MGKVVSAAFFPAPLQVIPEIGRNDSALFGALDTSMKQAAGRIKAANPQTVVILSRYKFTLADAIGMSPQARLRGTLDGYGAPGIAVGAETDHILSQEIRRQSSRMGIPIVDILGNMPTLSTQDYLLHYTAVLPLHYLHEAGLGGKQIVRLTMGRLSYEELYTFGKTLQLAAEASRRNIAVIGSANMMSPHGASVNDEKLDFNVLGMKALADRKPALLQNIGYPPEEEYCFRVISFILGAVSGLTAAPDTHFYDTIKGTGYGLMQYAMR